MVGGDKSALYYWALAFRDIMIPIYKDNSNLELHSPLSIIKANMTSQSLRVVTGIHEVNHHPSKSH